MSRARVPFVLAGLVLCLSSMPIQAVNAIALQGSVQASTQARVRPGQLVVEVLEITDGSPVAGIRVELVQTGESRLTDEAGRVVFALLPGRYDVRVYGLTGPGPAARVEEAHATVRPGKSTLVQFFNCGICV